MSSSKANDLKKAEKFVQQGKISAAIKEYRNLVASNPNDLTLINTLGDLCVRDGQIDEAMMNFTTIGESYSQNGFTLKAIAMYKKIYKLAPGNIDISYKLAELYSKQGLVVDARKQYMDVADVYTGNGKTRQALDILRKIADLEPRNTIVRLKLAEGYESEKMDEQAHDAYITAGTQLLDKGNLLESKEIFLKALNINSASETALNEIAKIFVKEGELQKAIAMISSAIQNNPENSDLVSLIGRIYFDADLLDEAEKSFLELIQKDKSKFEYLLKLGRRFVDIGESDRAIKLVDECMNAMIPQRQEAVAVELLNAITELDPYSIKAHQCLCNIYTRLSEDYNLITALKGLVEAAMHHQEKEIIEITLNQLTELEPDNPTYRQKLQSLGLSIEVSPSIVTREKNIIVPVIQNSNNTNFQFSGDFSLPDSKISKSTNEVVKPQENQSTKLGSGIDISKHLLDADRYASRGYADRAVELLEEVITQHPTHIEARLKLKEIYILGGILEKAAEQCLTLSKFYKAQGNHSQSQVMIEEARQLNPDIDLDVSQIDSNNEVLKNSTSGSIEIDISTGFDAAMSGTYHKPNLTSLDKVVPENLFPSSSESDAFYSGAPHPTASEFFEPASAQLSSEGSDTFSVPQFNFGFSVPSDISHTQETKIHEELEGVDFYLNQGYVDLAKDTLNRLNENFPDNVEVKARLNRLSKLILEQSGKVATPIISEVDPPVLISGKEEIKEPITAVQNDSIAQKENETFGNFKESGLQDIFDEFKQSVEKEIEQEQPDFETHYNLGLAYKDMELFDEAIEEFQTSIRSVNNDISDSRYFQSCNMLGLCFISKAMPQPAAVWFKRGLDAIGRSEDEYQAMRFDLGIALEQQGKYDMALEMFETVYALDINYRDVSTKIKEIKEKIK